jgi:hypothetical protein
MRATSSQVEELVKAAKALIAYLEEDQGSGPSGHILRFRLREAVVAVERGERADDD